MTRTTLVTVTLLVSACGGGSASGPATQASGNTAIASFGASVSAATPLTAGGTASGQVTCPGEAFVGPFEFQAEGDALVIAPRIRSVGGAQSCVGGTWVDGSGTFIGVAEGFGCAEGDAEVGTEATYNYRPSAGESNANPIYLRIAVAENTCAGATVTLTRR